MPRGIRNVKPAEPIVESLIEADPEAPPARMVSLKLKRHYRPNGAFEIVGHYTKEVIKKRASGEQYVAEPSVFVHGSKAPPPVPGVGFDNKIWTDTIIRLTEDEAREIHKAGIGERSFED